MPVEWIVLKFGGTSVARREQWEAIATLARQRRQEGCHVLLVCSALAGVTNLLTELSRQPESDETFEEFLQRHRDLAADLAITTDGWFVEGEQMVRDALRKLTAEPGPMYRAELIALGEWFSTRIGAEFLRRELDVHWVDAREALEVAEERHLSPKRRWLSASCHALEDELLNQRWSALGPILITQGFVARGEEGRTALLGRGGSDTSAALLAGRLNARRLEIWTDVPGLFSADPRQIPEARLLHRVDYAEALEMAAGGARVVHPRCIRAAAETRTPLVVRDMTRQHIAGTRIDGEAGGREGVKTVTRKENMAVLLLRNLDARHQVGFLADVFSVFRERGVSIDLVATSETTTTVAINRDLNHLETRDLDRLTEDLSTYCSVELHADCVCVNLVGQGVRTALESLGGVMALFRDHALLMASMSANDVCLSLLVKRGVDHELLKSAHRALIPGVGDGHPHDTHAPADIFGESWHDMLNPV